MEILESAVVPSNERRMSEMFRQAGWNVLGVDSGASSALPGTFISGMGETQVVGEFDCSALAARMETGVSAVSSRTKAWPGDKTMMDALVPAVEVFRSAAAAGKSAAIAMDDAAAAPAGAESTRNLVARYGRAKYLGEKIRGCPDVEATSIALLFRGFNLALGIEKEN